MRQSFSSTLITWGSETKTLAEWASLSNIPYVTVRMRYMRGVRDPESLFAQPRAYTPTGAHSKRSSSSQRESGMYLTDWFPRDTTQVIRHVAEQHGITPVQLVVEVMRHWATKQAEKLTPVNKEGDDL